MENQLAIFNFIKEQGGTAYLDQLKQKFNQVLNVKALLEENSLFWISKITENNWEIRAKLDVELCTSYLQGICDGSCTYLHICKSFLLSGKFCNQPCKSGFSHDIKDSHNKTVLKGYNMDDYGMKLLRSSFPRLCASFRENGKCEKLFCDYLHLCALYVQGKCRNECQLAAQFALSKKETHGLTSRHNAKVFSSFDLLQKKRHVLLGNILFEIDNETEMNSEKSQSVFKDSDQGKSKLQESNIRMCLAYLNGVCGEGSDCNRLHFCKEVLIDFTKCPGNNCKHGFSHDPFDENNCKIIKSKWKNIEDKVKIITAMGESFPRVCRLNEKKSCRNKDCKKLHICRYFLFDVCENKGCTLSHKLTDKHNIKVFKHYNMTSLITQKKDIIVSNILVSKVYKRKEIRENNLDGDSNQGMKILEESNSLKLVRCSFEDKEVKVSGSTTTQRHLMLCSYYFEGKCDEGNYCKRLHLCKEFLINFKKCPKNICRFGFSHDPFDENNAKIIASKWSDTDAKKIISFLRESFPCLCKNYEKEGCKDGNCKRLHICEDYLFNKCKSNDCFLSHKITDEHNSNVFKRYNLADLSKKSMAYILPNILISEKFASASDSGIRAYTNLDKSHQSSSRTSLNKSTESIFGANGNINSPHLESDESIIFSNEETNATVKPSVEDVSSYVLGNFDQGYCMINDTGFQLRFLEKSEEEVLKWCEIQKRYFRLNVCEKGTVRIYPCFADVEPCSLHWTRLGCKKEKCGKFHICKRLMLDEIHNHNSCTQNHSLENEKLKLLVKDSKLESLTNKQILILLRNRLPFVCSNYQINSCKEGNRHCPKLHICQSFLTKKCKKTEDICELDHETALTSKQAERIAEEFHVPLNRLQSVVLIQGVKQKVGITNFKGMFFSYLEYEQRGGKKSI